MRLLLDTHALLWWINPSHLLSRDAHEAIADPANDVLVSAVSAFEIATKNRIGKLPEADALVAEFVEAIRIEGFDTLAISVEVGLMAGRMDHAHRDPFDRLLIAQALIEDVQLVSNETLFDGFGVKRLW